MSAAASPAAAEVELGIVGNPNCGKSTLFNGLTGAKQHIGNWPGVTVERQEGEARLPSGRRVRVVDTPGIYSLTAVSEDERATLGYILGGSARLYVNVLDATALERNLYLTLLLCELKVPMVVVVTMMDVARSRGLEIDLGHLEHHLGVPVVGINATERRDLSRLEAALEAVLDRPPVPTVALSYPNELEREIDTLASACVKTARAHRVEPRWVALKALEGDPLVLGELRRYHDLAAEIVGAAVARCQDVLADPPDVVLADSRYGVIAGLRRDVVRVRETRVTVSERLDRVLLNRFLGIPMFLLAMYLVFWFTEVVGGAFVEFFDLTGEAVFVTGAARLLEALGAPGWLEAVVAHGAGTALRTVGTFVPIVGCMFLCLSVLEDSGYMARAAFVMDRAMRFIGLPGKSFVPLLVGFGCTVPAVMATRALDSKRDRLLTVFMIPFMSCGAKLPIWTLFAAAFVPESPGKLVALMYLTGVVLGVGTGLLMKHTLFKGEPTHFIMELPPYHCPRLKHILLHTWERLRLFLWRAGAFIVPMMLVMGVMNSLGTDGTVGNEGSERSVLAAAGKAVTPVFEPLGVERDNWPASVAVFTGLFAKESVIGTMKGLYAQQEAPAGAVAAARPSPAAQFRAALASVPRNLARVGVGLLDPLGLGYVDGAAETETEAGDAAAASSLARHFPKGFCQVFSYLLFVLLYVPCVAATGTVFHEIGKFYGTVFVVYLTLLGWSCAVVFHALTVSHSLAYLAVGLLVPLAMFGGFWLYGRRPRG